MQITDYKKEPKTSQIGLAVGESMLARWEKAINDLKAIDKTLSVPDMGRARIESLLEEIEAFVKNHKSKVLDLSVLSK